MKKLSQKVRKRERRLVLERSRCLKRSQKFRRKKRLSKKLFIRLRMRRLKLSQFRPI
jgi:hypothetical protein